MGLLIFGVVLLGGVLGVFFLKDELRVAWLARLAYSEFMMRLAVVAAALILIGLLMLADQLFSAPAGA